MPQAAPHLSTANLSTANLSTANLSKGEATRLRIVQRALELASSVGLEGLTIGELANDMALSKSGLFAHFRSKERLQLAVLEEAAKDFGSQVFVPAFHLPRGEERLRAIFGNWLGWIQSSRSPGGCIFLAGAMEWDDREGPVRDAIVAWFQQLYAALCKSLSLCVDTGQFRPDLDVEQFASEMHGIVLKFHLDIRLLRNRRGRSRAEHAFDRLVDAARV